MKKIIALALTMALILAMATTVFAAEKTLTEDGDSTTIAVYGSVLEDGTKYEVISVDIEYGSMEFTYVAEGTEVWNPDNHTYTATTADEWIANKGADTIKVTNHSNVDINVTASFAVVPNLGVTGSLSQTGAVKLAAGVENAYDSADNTTYTVALSGNPSFDTRTQVGTITVAIAKAI